MVNRIRRSLHYYFTYNRFQVIRSSPYKNIYHCCTQKTASQWFRRVFSDPVFYRYTGLRPLPYSQLGLKEAYFEKPLPGRTIAIHLYVDFPTYVSIPKPARYKTFFVVRDPRDIVVSWYFSAKYSHPLIDPIPRLRKRLEKLSMQQGMKYIIDAWDEFGLFEAQRSWMQTPEDVRGARVFRYKTLAADNFLFLKKLFDYLKIELPEKELNELYKRHEFATITGGRQQGVADQSSHYRKGVPGEWRRYFDDSTMAYFKRRTGDLLEVLGYPE
jgi:hypothetical protein